MKEYKFSATDDVFNELTLSEDVLSEEVRIYLQSLEIDQATKLTIGNRTYCVERVK